MRWGVEQELRVWRGPRQLDFRLLVGRTGLPCLDPGDPRARRLPSGVALTADGWEAELASPPMAVCDGPTAVDLLLRGERESLQRFVLAQGADRLEGFSTHLNVSVPDDRAVDVARGLLPLVPALAQVVEPPGSSGILVRPRRHRLEVGGEYVDGLRLRAGLVLLACAVAALVDGEDAPGATPRHEASREKFGWFVPPASSWSDAATLHRAWTWCGDRCSGLGLDPDAMDVVLGGGSVQDDGAAAPPLPPHDGRGPRTTPAGLSAVTEWLTWDHAAWSVSDSAGRRAFVVVRAEEEAALLARLDAGVLDDALTRFLGRRRRTSLLVNRELGAGGWWHELRPAALVPAERGPDGRVPQVDRRRARADLREQRRAAASVRR